MPTPDEMARTIVKEESWRQIMSSLVICFFARGIYQPEIVARALAVARTAASIVAWASPP